MRILLLLFMLGFSIAGLSSPEAARQWLERMNQAIASQDYEGHFVYLCNKSMEAMRIRHWNSEDGPKESLFSLTGVAREVLRDNKAVTIITNANGQLQISQHPIMGRLSPVKSLRPDVLLGNYSLSMEKPERVAGRQAVVVRLQPSDGYRYGYRVRLDQISALPLGLEVLDNKGHFLSQIMFTDLKVFAREKDWRTEPEGSTTTPPPEAQSSSLPPADAVKAASTPALPAVSSSWVFTALPPGYRLMNYKRGQEVEHFVFSDGVATVSAYLEPVDGDEYFRGFTQLGSVNAYGSVVDGFQLTLVGEVPRATLKMLASGLVHHNSAAEN